MYAGEFPKGSVPVTLDVLDVLSSRVADSEAGAACAAGTAGLGTFDSVAASPISVSVPFASGKTTSDSSWEGRSRVDESAAGYKVGSLCRWGICEGVQAGGVQLRWLGDGASRGVSDLDRDRADAELIEQLP